MHLSGKSAFLALIKDLQVHGIVLRCGIKPFGDGFVRRVGFEGNAGTGITGGHVRNGGELLLGVAGPVA